MKSGDTLSLIFEIIGGGWIANEEFEIVVR